LVNVLLVIFFKEFKAGQQAILTKEKDMFGTSSAARLLIVFLSTVISTVLELQQLETGKFASIAAPLICAILT
jgi:hypothetical protein